jgi:hypothetical protein
MNDAEDAVLSEICEAFAWVAREGTGPIAVPLSELTRSQWEQLVRRLGREARRRLRAALEAT